MTNNASYPAVNIASYIIRRSNERGRRISNLELQIILYFCVGEIFRKHGTPLVVEDFYAWSIGPVVREVYDVFCLYGGYPIPPNSVDDGGRIDEKYLSDIDAVIDKCITYQGYELIQKACETEPWKYTYKIFGYRSRISKASIENFFGENDSIILG